MPLAKPMPPIGCLEKALFYDPYSGIFIWKERPLSHFATLNACRKWNTAHAGTRAGTLRVTKKGYCFIAILFTKDGLTRYLPAHRVAWLLSYGEEPPKSIDHIDGDTSNNRLINLRDGDVINQRNARMRSDNTSGITGVYWDGWHRKWRASIRVSGKRIRLGSYAEEDLDLAAMEVMEARIEAGFSNRHGF